MNESPIKRFFSASLDTWLNRIAGVLALVAFFVQVPERQKWIALAAILALAASFVLTFGVRTWIDISRLLKSKYPLGYTKIAAWTHYFTADGAHVRYETYKAIQSKRIALKSIPYQFSWSGSKGPMSFSSEHQRLGPIEKGRRNGDWDEIEICFERPLRYNDTEVVHVAMELDDSDRVSETRVTTRVEEPIQFLYWRVCLMHAPAAYAARATLTRRRIDSAAAFGQKETLGEVSFNHASKCFEHHLHAPEVGYHYTLWWDRP